MTGGDSSLDGSMMRLEEDQMDLTEQHQQHEEPPGPQFPYSVVNDPDKNQVESGAETIHLAEHMDDDNTEDVETDCSPVVGPNVTNSQQPNVVTVHDAVVENDTPPDTGTDNSEPDVNAFVRDPATILSGSGEILLAREMAKLSMTEREAIMNDIHGVAEDECQETPALIAEKLALLETKIQQLNQERRNNDENGRGTAAYYMAFAMSPEYVQDPTFRLMFLRAAHFDVDQAAKRIIKHFEKKLELFGVNKLVKTIALDDLDADDNECLQCGQSQLLPYRDRSGRAVFLQALSHYRFKEVINAMRVVYYVLMCAVEDEETQKKGIVSVVYNVEPKSPLANDPRIYLNVYQLLPALPIRMMGAHYCVQDSGLRRFMSSIRVAMSRELRLRSRVHHGSHQECTYTLMTFGVPRKCFPISSTGELLVEKHMEFLAMRRKQEMAAAAAATVMKSSIYGDKYFLSLPLQQQQQRLKRIIVPTNVDVLLGRGRPFQEHAGNLRCNFVVMAAMEEYEKVSRNDKTGIARNVIGKIESYGGRFLKQTDGVWEEVDDTETLRKISHSFRTHRQLLKAQQDGKGGTTEGRRALQRSKKPSIALHDDSSAPKRQREGKLI
jgi:hypothetical protein